MMKIAQDQIHKEKTDSPKKTVFNLALDETCRKTADTLLQGKTALFEIAGDLNLEAMYAPSAFLVTDMDCLVIDPTLRDGFARFPRRTIKRAWVKRMYSNSILRIETTDNQVVDMFRSTYAVTVQMEAVAEFLTHVAQGAAETEEYEIVAATFEKAKCFCPKCGRPLRRPGAQCLNCMDKKKMAGKLLVYLKPYIGILCFCLILSLITTAMALVPPSVTAILVDTIIPQKRTGQLMLLVVGLLLVYIIQYGIGAVRGNLMRATGDKIVTQLRNDIFTKAQRLPMSFYDKTSTGSVISRVSSDTATLQSFMLRISQEAVVQLFQLIGIIVLMFCLNWKLTLLSLTPVPLVVFGAKHFGRKLSPCYRRLWRRHSAFTSILTDILPGIRVVKAFTNEDNSAKRFTDATQDWLQEDIHASKIANVFTAVVGFLVTCGSLLIWGVGGNWVIHGSGTLTLGLLVSFISYTQMFYTPVNFFAYLNDSYQNTLASAERVLDVLDADPENNFGEGNHITHLQGRVEFRNVSFSFDKTKKVLDNVSFTLEPGDIVGIVGTTGSGKTTLINLLMRYYDNDEGEILVDGQDIRDLDLENYRESIGYVQQEPLMFRDTVFSNIAYGKNDATVEEVLSAADIANCHGFITRLPDAYDTMLGERGTGLSGGEKQRISIARAVLKNPGLLIFDEATASVDSETEHLIQDAIERLIAGRTTLMIAHRLSTLRRANKIIVMENGKILEMGTPDELLEKKGKYYTLVNIQSMSEQLLKEKQAANIE